MRRPALAVRDIEVSSVLDRLKVAIRLTSFEHLVVRITDLESSAKGATCRRGASPIMLVCRCDICRHS